MHRLKSLAGFGFQPEYILDIGANVGSWTDQMAHFFPDSHFLMIEANPKHEDHLQGICNQHQKVDFSINLLDEVEKDSRYYTIKNATADNLETGNSIFKEKTNHYSDNNTEVKIIKSKTLDSLLENKKINKVDFIKLDVQGGELSVLKGASKTLEQTTFCLLEVQLQQWNQDAPLFSEVISFMKENNFLVFDFIDKNLVSDYTVSIDVLFKKQNNKFTCPNISK